MWHTPSGDRVLNGNEAAFLKAALTSMVESIMDESTGYLDQWDYGIPLFDDLPWSQRLLLLEQVATYLLTETREPLKLTAVSEAAVGVLFGHALAQIEREIDEDSPRPTQWRKLALAAYTECEFESDEDDEDSEDDWLPASVDCTNQQQWSELLELLADRILWDRDYEMESAFLDGPPEQVTLLKEFLGIDPEYFSEPAPDVASNVGIDQVLRRLNVLAHDDAST